MPRIVDPHCARRWRFGTGFPSAARGQECGTQRKRAADQIQTQHAHSLLVVVVDWLACWGHHDWLALHLGLHLTKHLIAHHVHHGVHSALELLRHLLGRWHHHLWLQHVDVVWIVHVVQQVVHLHLADALILQEVLGLVEVKAHLLDLLQEALFLVNEILGHHANSLVALRAH